MDSRFVVDVIRQNELGGTDYYSLVGSIQELISRNWTVTFERVYREVIGLPISWPHGAPLLPWDATILINPFGGVRDVMREDISGGVSFPRFGLA